MSCLFLLHFPLIIFLALPLSNGDISLNYKVCSTGYSCGHIKNIGYPFWGDNRPKFCGMSDFKLSCNDKQNYPTMFVDNHTSNAYGYGGLSLSVLSINTSFHTMVFNLTNFFNRCFKLPMNISDLLSTLKPDTTHNNNNISLFYNCPNNCDHIHNFKSFPCSYYEGFNGKAYYSDEPSDISKSRDNKLCSCKNHVTFPVDRRELAKIRSSTNATLKSTLQNLTITMAYIANFTACTTCERSGGYCGSSEDPSSGKSKFLCHCREGSQRLVCKENKIKGLTLGIGITVGVILILAAFISIWCYKKLKFETQNSALDCNASELEKGSIYFGVPLFSYSELVEATSNFDKSNELGNGGFGIVYYGKLKDGREVAVKHLYEKSRRRLEQFMNEVQILTCLRHQNLVSLYGCTSHHCRELLLVYEYVKNGTVADHLHGERTKSGLLPWPLRLRIAIETASALSYLHASEIIHRDVKTNNILLDSNFCAKVADFGLSRLFPIDVTHVSTTPQGTPGYIDPEYHQCYQLTNKSDVYSFGVVLIELVSSLPAIDLDRHKHEINLSNYAMNRIQRCAFDELVDPQLGFNSNFKVRRTTRLVAELAFQCLQHNKEFRPSMDEVLEVLKSIEDTDYEVLQAEETAASVAIESSEALQTEETDENAAVEYHDALQAEDTVKNAGLVVEKMHTSDSLSSPVADDHAELLSTDRSKYSSSPISVIGKWISRTTTPSSSNGSK